jgi:hypothetical protein
MESDDEAFVRGLLGTHAEDWVGALESLEESADASKLAALMKSFAPPEWVAKEIGNMLAPPKGYRGPHLSVDMPRKSRSAAFHELKKKRDIRERIREVRGEGKLEPALIIVGHETKLSRAWLMQIWKMDFEAEFRTILGQTDGEDRESKKK